MKGLSTLMTKNWQIKTNYQEIYGFVISLKDNHVA